ncbi:MAG TPA: glycosyltransferase [Bryobacteraceae bacterium]|jgi:glycosyltransferase involved in cell wall biosynthesis|nr:glycosyltransferase [Bryobacteraceae bacterium]
MRILHVPYTFYPEAVGGTEVYVLALATSQHFFGSEVAIAAPATAAASYVHDGFKVWRFPVSSTLTLAELYGDGDPVAAQAFGVILDEFKPDIVHLHAMTSAVSPRLARQARQRGCLIVFNYHTPTVSCARGTLLKWGSRICNGDLETSPCAACALTNRGVPGTMARFIASLPSALGDRLAEDDRSGGIWTALRIPQLTSLRQRAFHSLMEDADRIVALCNWTEDLLVRNGVPASKLVLCRQGISWPPAGALSPVQSSSRPSASLPLRAAFLGRIDATKGPHVILQGLMNNPRLPLSLDVFGVFQNGADSGYAARIRTAAAQDSRVKLLPSIPSAQVIDRLAEYDVVVVPSQLLETGPLVVLEAFAAGTPVIGSNLGGIAELITSGRDGLLVEPYSSPAAWAAVLQKICDEPALLDVLRAGILPPRPMRQVALDLVAVYESALHLRESSLHTHTQ